MLTTRTGSGIGASLQRKEDDRHLRGRGEFVSDLQMAGTHQVVFLRSPHAHARIRSIAIPPEARGHVFTAADLPRMQPIRIVSRATGARSPAWPPLATDKVRYVGEAIAACVAPTRTAAEDIANAVTVDFEPLEAVVGRVVVAIGPGEVQRCVVRTEQVRPGAGVQQEGRLGAPGAFLEADHQFPGPGGGPPVDLPQVVAVAVLPGADVVLAVDGDGPPGALPAAAVPTRGSACPTCPMKSCIGISVTSVSVNGMGVPPPSGTNCIFSFGSGRLTMSSVPCSPSSV